MGNIIYKLHVVSLLILEQIYINQNHISKYNRDIGQTDNYNGRKKRLWQQIIGIYHLHILAVFCRDTIHVVYCKERNVETVEIVYQFEQEIIEGACMERNPFNIIG